MNSDMETMSLTAKQCGAPAALPPVQPQLELAALCALDLRSSDPPSTYNYLAYCSAGVQQAAARVQELHVWRTSQSDRSGVR